ncbi:MAG: response regulator [Phycisphaerae bacterium]
MAANSVQLDTQKLDELLASLDREGVSFSGRGAGEEFFPYRQAGLSVRLISSGSPNFRVPTRQISAQHLVFLHASFIHERTRCVVELITTHNMWQAAEGTIVTCRHISGRVHEAVVRFAREINVSKFVRHAVRRSVLVVDDEPTCARLLAHYLKEMKTNAQIETSGRAGVDAALRGGFDLVLMDVDMPEMDGLAAVKELREHGYEKRIVAVTGMTGDGDRERCLQAGFDDYISKPITREQLSTTIDCLEEEPLFSSLAGQSDLDPLINSFVESLKPRGDHLRTALGAKDAKTVTRIARSLKGEAASYGFQPLTDAAVELEKADQPGYAWDLVLRDARKVLKLASLVQPTETHRSDAPADGAAADSAAAAGA